MNRALRVARYARLTNRYFIGSTFPQRPLREGLGKQRSASAGFEREATTGAMANACHSAAGHSQHVQHPAKIIDVEALRANR